MPKKAQKKEAQKKELNKAQELGISLVSEAEFLNKIQE
jgi:hypothetical protein